MKTATDLEVFADRLVEEKGIKDVSPEVLAQIKKDLIERAENRINAAVLECLSADQLENFEKLLDKSSEEQVRSFLAEQIPNMNEIVAAELLDFRNIYLA